MPQESAAATVVEANMFEITGPIVISYTQSGITGEPLFSYRDAERDLNLRGSEITRSETPLGELVTIKVEEVVDAFVRTFTLIVPRIRLQRGDQPAFDTIGVETIDRSSAFVLAPGPTGVLQTYRVHELTGVAQFVIS